MTRAGTPRTAVGGALLLVAGLLVAPAAAVAAAPERAVPTPAAPVRAAPAPRPADSAPAAADAIAVSGTRVFSPDGDGVKDVARIRYTLDRRGPVTVEVRVAPRNDVVELRRRLGRQGAGAHVWAWDGRVSGGEPAADASYVVRVLSRGDLGQHLVQVDRRFRVRLGTDPSYGARRRDPVVVHPRSRVVTDEVGLVATAVERDVDRGRLVVRDPAGRVVAKAPMRRLTTTRSAEFGARLAWEARGRDGRPLAPGNYEVSVRGTDLAGNPATSRPFEVRVSRRSLVWREETRTVVPAESTTSPCARTTAMGCGLVTPCGTVQPSDRFAGGLSIRSAVCSDPGRTPGAESWHITTVEDAVRGIGAYRLAFAGEPTRVGEADPVTVDIGAARVSSSSGAQTPWLTTGPYLDGDEGDGFVIAPLRPSVVWTATTAGDDSFDVASFTVDLRYLAVED